MFFESQFNGDISRRDVSNATSMKALFCHSVFNGDISNWNVSNVENIDFLFNKTDGEISPEMCTKSANDLEKLVPRMIELVWDASDNIERAGGFVSILEKFITGCRMAAKHNEPLYFH